MNKHIVIAGVLVAGAFTSMAATVGTIVIQGKVPASTDIVVTPTPGYNTLPLIAGATALQVATVNEKSNWPKGYKVTLQSLNAGAGTQAFLKGADPLTLDVVNYTMSYNAVAVTLVAGSAQVTTTGTRTGPAGVDKPLTITFAANPWIAADTYSDTVTLTIAVN